MIVLNVLKDIKISHDDDNDKVVIIMKIIIIPAADPGFLKRARDANAVMPWGTVCLPDRPLW